MRSSKRAWQIGALSLVLAAATGFGPSGDGAKVTKEQLEYSKQMFAEGEAAMEAGNHALAFEKYREGYRYAPHLHVFTFNIASAADAMGDCRSALTYFQMFVDLVPEHPKRKEAKQRLATLNEECKFDAETETLNTAPPEGEDPGASGSSAHKSHAERQAIRAMNDALFELRSAQKRYEASKAVHPTIKAFKRAAKRKKKHAKKLLKVAIEAGVELDDRPIPAIEVPKTSNQACREAESQENRIIDEVEQMLEHYDTAKAYKVGGKILNAAQNRDRRAFDACG